MSTPSVSDAAGDALVLALTDVIKGASGPEIQQAQAMLLRRLATQGDVIPSRIPAPRNITEVGGYLNLLTELGETTMCKGMLGAALGLAASVPADDGAGGTVPPLRLVQIANDRLPSPAGDGVPLSVGVRQDLAAGLQAAVADVRAAAGHLPLWGPPAALPAPTGGTGPTPDPLPYLGREVWVAPTAALTDPETDPIVLGRASTDPGAGYRVGVRVADGTAEAESADWVGLKWDAVGGAFLEAGIGTVTMLALEKAIAATPFVSRPLTAVPPSRGDYAWARMVAVAGLLPGASRLGDELALVWTGDQIVQSAYADHLDAVWDGAAFV
ncbi:hypothetical protein L2X99_10630 [Microbacterium sp. KUDC0406]|uniref:hypothetical protein n=1 Tax=Microbacterium sp. KUDC0406 TaxID=2909588 RepID=UPI001F223902|nr:hypothetical protein [Microbacterium sp. KUDC0406]UJP08935.1 hypothetical protein L2X99_10630 [Microbacterium sp. KUDC0406]